MPVSITTLTTAVRSVLSSMTVPVPTTAAREWNLISESDKCEFTKAVAALRSRLDTGSKTLFAQEFKHTLQKEQDSVSD